MHGIGRQRPHGEEMGGSTRSLGGVFGRITGAAALALALAGPAAAGQIVYAFVDSRGVVHFTNVPNDPRYAKMVLAERGGLRPAGPSHGAPADWRFDGLIKLTARENSLPPALVKAVIAAESAFDPDAVSHKGAQGLMQLMPRTAAQLGVADPFEPHQNVSGGARYLREMLDRYGDLARALAAYNAGPTAVDRHRGVPPYRETRAYVKRVLAYYRDYHGDFGR
ncbi:MAG: lytic transglycosylase domain-containing protein [Myxococcota bacterium]